MKFNEIEFSNPNAKRIYVQYINQVKSAIKVLNKENQTDTLLEINSHIYEFISNSPKNEIEAILDITEKLGDPKEFLKELVAAKKLDEATQSFNPIKILKALLLNLTNGISYIIFFVLYVSLFLFVFLIFSKIFDPANTGFFYKKSEFFVFGRFTSSIINYHQYEQLGNWFIPVMLLLILVLYVLITLLLRIKRKIKN